MRKARSTRPSLKLVARSASHSPCCRSVRSPSFCLASSAWLRVSRVRAQASASATSIRISARSIFSKLESTRSALSRHSAMRYSLSSLADTSLSETLPFLDALAFSEALLWSDAPSLSSTLPPSEKLPFSDAPPFSLAMPRPEAICSAKTACSGGTDANHFLRCTLAGRRRAGRSWPVPPERPLRRPPCCFCLD